MKGEIAYEKCKDKVAIVGVGYTPQGRVAGRSTLSFHIEAARNAILDAGLTPKDIDGILTQLTASDLSANPWDIAQFYKEFESTR